MDSTIIYALIPITGITFSGLILLSFTRLGKALANRLEGRLDPATDARLSALEATNEELRQALAEANERIDFTERAITRGAIPEIPTPV